VASIGSHQAWAKTLELQDLGFESFPGFDVQFFGGGECLIELMEFRGGDPTVDARVERHGGGLHHLAFGVPDVVAALADAAARSLDLIGHVHGPGARGTMIGFVDPHEPDVTFVEFVQDRPGDSTRPVRGPRRVAAA